MTVNNNGGDALEQPNPKNKQPVKPLEFGSLQEIYRALSSPTNASTLKESEEKENKPTQTEENDDVLKILKGFVVQGDGDSSVNTSDKPVDDNELIKEAIKNLGSNRHATRSAAKETLETLDEKALPFVVEALKNRPEFEVEKELKKFVENYIDKKTELPWERGGNLLMTPPITPDKLKQLDELLKETDKLTRSPQDNRKKATALNDLGKVEGLNIDPKLLFEKISSLNDAGIKGSELRTGIALALINDGDRESAKKYLGDALKSRKEVVTEPKFLKAVAGSGLSKDKAFMEEFEKAGGDVQLLKRFENPGKAEPGQSNFELFSKIGINSGGTEGMTAPDRLSEYKKLQSKDGTDTKRLQILGDHYRTAGNDQQRKQALELLNKEYENGNRHALNYSQMLPIATLIEKAQISLPHGHVAQKFDNAEERLAEINRQMKQLPSERKRPDDVPNLLVEHYRNAKNSQEREEALSLLKKEVISGNQSAQFTLVGLTRMDAALKLGDGLHTRQFGEPAEKQGAEKKIELAVKELARIDHFDDLRDQKSKIGKDLLFPATGEQNGPQKTGQNRVPRSEELLKQVFEKTGSDRDETLKSLENLSEKFKGSAKGKDFQSALDLAKTTFAAQDVLFGLHDTDKTTKALLQLGKLKNPDSMEFLKRLNASKDKDGQKLAKALITNNERDTLKLLRDNPALVELVGKEAKRIADNAEPSNRLTGNQLIELPGLHELYQAGRQEAKDFDKDSLRDAADAVAKYLTRDSIGKENRKDVLKHLPSNDKQLKLGVNDTELKDALKKGLSEKSFSNKASRLAERLLNGEEVLNAKDLTEFKNELSQTGDGRKKLALEELQKAAEKRVSYTGLSLMDTCNTVQSLEALGKVHSDTEKTLETFQKTDNAKEREETLTGLMKSLKEFERLANNNGQHKLAEDFYKQFGGKEQFENLYKSLGKGAGDPKEIEQSLRKIQQKLPDGEEQINQYRALRIVQALGPESSPNAFASVTAELKTEIEASKTESKSVNKHAVEWQKWTQTQEQVATLSQSAGTDNKDGETRTKAVDTLVKQAKDGNGYAKTALAAMLIEGKYVTAFLNQFPTDETGKPIFVPNLSNLSDNERAALEKQVLKGLVSVIHKERSDYQAINGDKVEPEKALSAQEIMAIGLGLARLKQQRAPDEKAEDLYKTVLSSASCVSDNGRGEVMTGLLVAMNVDDNATRDLADYYIKGLGHKELAKHFTTLQAMALDGNQGALRVMAAIAAGNADFNSEQALNPRKLVEGEKGSILLESNPISMRARKTLEQAAETSPENRKLVVQSLLHVQSNGANGIPWHKDSKQLLATLGTVASSLDDSSENQKLKRQALDQIRQGFEQSMTNLDERQWKRNEEFDRKDDTRYQSSLEGMKAMAPFWSEEDAEAFTKRLTPDVVKALAEVGSQLPKDVAKDTLTRLQDKAAKIIQGTKDKEAEPGKEDPATELRNTIKAMTTLSSHVDVGHVEFLAGLGGKNSPLNKRFSKSDDVFKVQAEAGRALLNVLAKTNNATSVAETGPREAAYNAFKKTYFPISNESGNGWLDSNKSTQLCLALADFYKGRPWDISLSKEINRIVDDAMLPKPAALLLAELNIGSTNPKDYGTGETVWEKAEKLIANYSVNGQNGEEVLRRVLANIELANNLPSIERARLMGWDKLPEEKQEELGWLKGEPTESDLRFLGFESLSEAEQKATANDKLTGKLTEKQWKALEDKGKEQWQKMSDSEKEEFRSQNFKKVDVTKVLGQMYNNVLQNKEGTDSALLSDKLFDNALRLHKVHFEAAQESRRESRKATLGYDGAYAKLITKTKNGASFGNQLIGLVNVKNSLTATDLLIVPALTSNNGRDVALEGDQKLHLGQMERFSRLNSKEGLQTLVEDRKAQEMELAISIARHKLLVNNGEQLTADKLAVNMWRNHGIKLSSMAPEIWKSLTVTEGDGLQGESSLKRLQKRGLAHFDMVPGYSQDAIEGVKGALGLVKAYNADDPRGLMQLKKEPLLDSTALRSHMMLRLDKDPVLSKFSDSSRRMGQSLNELSKMVDAGTKGHFYEDFANSCKERAAVVEKELNSIDAKDLQALEERIKLMEKALPDVKDYEAAVALEQRIKTYKDLHNLYNMGTPVYQAAEGKEVRNANKDTRSMIEMIKQGGFSESTFTNWLKENGPVIAATVVAIAATVATCATFGITSPFAVGAWIAVAGLVAREATYETLYQVNKNGYTGYGQYGQEGSKAGNWERHWEKRTPEERLKTLGSDVVGPYAVEFLRDYIAFLATAGLTSIAFEGAEGAVLSTAQSMTAVERAELANIASTSREIARVTATTPNAAAKSYLTEFMANFGKEMVANALFTGAQSSTEAAIHHFIGKENLNKMGEWGQFGLSFALSTGLAMGHGAKSQITAKLKSGSLKGAVFSYELNEGVTRKQFVDHLQQEGYVVKQIKGQPGEYCVLPIDAKPGMTPIKLQQVDAKGVAIAAKTTFDAPSKTNQRKPDEQVGTKSRTTDPSDLSALWTDYKNRLSNPEPDLVSLVGRNDLASAVQLTMDITELKAQVKAETESAKKQNLSTTHELEAALRNLRDAQECFDHLRLPDKAKEIVDRLATDKALTEYLKIIHEYSALNPGDTLILDTKRIQTLKDQLIVSLAHDKIAFAEHTNTFPPGEVMLRDPQGFNDQLNGLKLIVEGPEPVPRKLVDDVLEAIKRDGLRPEVVRIRNSNSDGAEGSLCEKTFEIFVGKSNDAHLVYLHEAGHLLDFKHLMPSGMHQTWIHNTWVDCLTSGTDLTSLKDPAKGNKWVDQVLRDTKHPCHAILKNLGEDAHLQKEGLSKKDLINAHRELLVELLQRPNFKGVPRDNKDVAVYNHSRSEVVAEMYKLYREKITMNASEMKPTFHELIEQFTSDPTRKAALKHFERMFELLSREVFPQQLVTERATLKLMDIQAEAMQKLAQTHGVGTKEFKEGARKLLQDSNANIPDCVVKALLDQIRTEHADNPDIVQKMKKHIHKIKEPGYNIDADQTLTATVRGKMRVQQRLFDQIRPKVEAHNKARTDNIQKPAFDQMGIDSVVIGNVIYSLDKPTVLGNDVLGLNKPGVEMAHVEVGRDGIGVYVIDNFSENGTYITGHKDVPDASIRIEPGKKFYIDSENQVLLGSNSKDAARLDFTRLRGKKDAGEAKLAPPTLDTPTPMNSLSHPSKSGAHADLTHKINTTIPSAYQSAMKTLLGSEKSADPANQQLVSDILSLKPNIREAMIDRLLDKAPPDVIQKEVDLARKYNELSVAEVVVKQALDLDPFVRRMFMDRLVNGGDVTRLNFSDALRLARAYEKLPTLEQALKGHGLDASELPKSLRKLRLEKDDTVDKGQESLVFKVAKCPEYPEGAVLKLTEGGWKVSMK